MIGRNGWLIATASLVLAVSLTCREDGCDRGTGPECRIVSGQPGVTALSAGPHDCMVTSGGAAYWWGGNGSGQLGDGSTTDRKTPVPGGGRAELSKLARQGCPGSVC